MGRGNFWKDPFRATFAAVDLKKTYDDATGRTQRNKAQERIQWAQNSYNEAGRLKSEYSSHIEPQIKNIENAMQSAIHNRSDYGSQLSSFKNNAHYLENDIRHRERTLADIGRSLQSSVSEYEAGIARHKEEVARFNEQGTSLQSLVDVFKREAPELSKSIEEYQKLPQDFLNRFEEQKTRRRQLEGFSREERGGEIDEFESGVNELKQKRNELEKVIHEKYGSLSERHQNLSDRHKNLTSSLQEYKTKQDQLLSKGDTYNRKRGELERVIGDYKLEEDRYNQELNKAKQLKADYDLHAKKYSDNENYIGELLKNAMHYDNVTHDYQNRINAKLEEAGTFERWAAGHAKKAQNMAKFNMIGGALLGAISGGLGLYGSSIGMMGGGLIGGGLGHLQNQITGLNKRLPSISVGDTHIDTDRYRNFQNAISGGLGNASHLGKNAPISSGMLGNAPKVNIPELGGWQSPQHFGIEQMPDIHQLPTLETALGRLKDPQELNNLTLGLPKLSGRDGKQYNFAVLYDPMYMQKFKNTMKKAQRYGASLLNSVNGNQVYA